MLYYIICPYCGEKTVVTEHTKKTRRIVKCTECDEFIHLSYNKLYQFCDNAKDYYEKDEDYEYDDYDSEDEEDSSSTPFCFSPVEAPRTFCEKLWNFAVKTFEIGSVALNNYQQDIERERNNAQRRLGNMDGWDNEHLKDEFYQRTNRYEKEVIIEKLMNQTNDIDDD